MPLTDGISGAQLRVMATEALIAANTLVGASVFPWGDWPTDPKLFPMLMVHAPRERKVNKFPGTYQFDATLTLVVVGRLVAPMPGLLGPAMETLREQVIDALCTDYGLNHAIQQVQTVEVTTTLSSEARQHIGEIVLTFEMVVFQEYGPVGSLAVAGVTGNFSVVGP
jgi:hypothetical protein